VKIFLHPSKYIDTFAGIDQVALIYAKLETRFKRYTMRILRTILFSLLFLSFTSLTFAGEGMWLPQLLKALNEGEMHSLGMKLSAEDIYSVNKSSLKDAIVHFGGFCTSELISDQGLLLTNHHCGYGQIQSHSSIDNNLLKNGFWAASKKEELANPGLFATFIDRIEDISKEALAGVNDAMSDKERQSTIDKNLESIKSGFALKEFQKLVIRPFYHGNQYFAFVTTTFNDVRLVGAPPESIGKFGSDTDNWVFPRHTGDFALFRIYAGPGNVPAEYSVDNVPYKPKHFLPISLDGVEEDDFTLVFGFPGRTNQYLPGAAVKQTMEVLNPAKIKIRDTALKIIDQYMRSDESVRIQYASKFARVANYWKKWIGENQGLKSTNALGKKQKFEENLMRSSKKGNAKSLLMNFNSAYADIEQVALTRDYYQEVAIRNIELLNMQRYIRALVKRYENNGEEEYNAYKQRISAYLDNFYKNYRPNIDQEVFASLVALYAEEVDIQYVPPTINNNSKMVEGKKDYTDLAGKIYGNSIFINPEKVKGLWSLAPKDAIAKIKMDPAYQLGVEWEALYNEKIANPYNARKTQIDSMQRIYMKSIMETFPKQTFYPDANSTMRVTYGQVKGYKPKDAVCYTPVTYLDGVIEKYVPGDYEFDVSDKLLELYESKDYGQYADTNGKVPVCFIGSNHTTGGNSGSPAIDAHGNLIGLNFDRVWEGTMSDINYDPSICRNIMVDARYILFIVDKYAGATHLIDEMKLVHPKGRK